ncbi:MAG TPA: POTRA domain-containing protein [Pyrinomonadaceae bacterium]|nr:POTRA domain-containing protein [Pyrinomonadaceae bacterium]
MTQRVVILPAITLALIFVPACVFTIKAQPVAVSRVVIPCKEEATPGRPTLKRRVVSAEETAAANPTDANTRTEKCKPENPESVAADQPVTLSFEGLISTNETKLRKYLKEKHADRTGELTGNSSYLEGTSQHIKEFLLSRGFRHATVTGRVDDTSADLRKATFVVSEGLRTPITEYHFEGNKIFSATELAQNIRECMTKYRDAYYDSQVFDYCEHVLANFVRSRGYLEAKFGEPRLEESSGALVINISVDEGVLYRFGEVKIEGSSLFSPEKLRAMSPLRKGEIGDGEKLSEWLYDKLKQLYGEHGYIQYTAELTPEFKSGPDKSEGVVDFKVEIDEGRCFKVGKIKFAGEQLPDNLESMMLIHGGDVYNASLYEKSIDNLNNSGLFEFVDKDKDADFRANEEERWVEITIMLKRKGQ